MLSINFSQGTAYSCQTLAAIGAIACNPTGKKKLNEICKPVADGFEIRFSKYPDVTIKVKNAELVEWNEEIRNEGEEDIKERIRRVKEIMPSKQFFLVFPNIRPENVSGDILVRVLELAYAKLMVAINPSNYPELSTNSPETNSLALYHHKSFHYNPAKSMNDITNWPVTELIANGGDRPELSGSFTEESKHNPSGIEKAYVELAKISNNPSKYVAVATSIGTPEDNSFFLDPGTKIVPWHDYSVKFIDDHNKTICLLDPFASRIGLLLEYGDFMQYFNTIITATVPIG